MKTFYLTFLLPLILSQLLAETITVSGKVMDENSEPISGVNIYSGADGVVSQIDGSFSLDVDEYSIVTFSHVGYNDVSFLPKTISDLVYMSSTIIDGKKIIVQAELITQNLFNAPSSISILTKKELELLINGTLKKNDKYFQNDYSYNYCREGDTPKFMLYKSISGKLIELDDIVRLADDYNR